MNKTERGGGVLDLEAGALCLICACNSCAV